jgi:hypothetical protein
MQTLPLRALTWGTAAAAVSSAVWLSSVGPAALLCTGDLRVPSEAFEFQDLIPAGSAPAAGPPAARSSASPLRPPSSSS